MDSIRDDGTRITKPVLSYRHAGGTARRQPRLTLRRRFSNGSEVSVASNQPTVGSDIQDDDLTPPGLSSRRGRTTRPTNTEQILSDPSKASRARSVPPPSDFYGVAPGNQPETTHYHVPYTAPLPPEPRTPYAPRYGTATSVRPSAMPRVHADPRPDPRPVSNSRPLSNPRTVIFDSETEETSSSLSSNTQATSVDSDGGYRNLDPHEKERRPSRVVPLVRRTARAGTSVRGGRRNLHMEVLAAQAQLQDSQNRQKAEEISALRSESKALARKHESLTRELEGTLSDLSTTRSELSMARSELSTARSDLAAARAELSGLRSEKEEAVKQRETQVTSLRRLKKDLEEQLQVLDDLRRNVDEKDRALADAQAERSLFRDAKNLFEDRCVELEKDLEAVRGGRKDHEALMITQIADLEMTRDVLQARADTAAAELATKETELINMTGERDTLAEELAAKETQLTSLTEAHDTLREASDKKDDQIAALSGERAAAEEENKSLHSRIEALEEDNAGLKGRTEALEGEKQELQVKVEALDAEKADMVNRLEGLEGEKSEMGTRIEGLEGEKGDLASQVESLQAEKAEQETKVAAVTTERDALQDEVAALRERLPTEGGETVETGEPQEGSTTTAGDDAAEPKVDDAAKPEQDDTCKPEEHDAAEAEEDGKSVASQKETPETPASEVETASVASERQSQTPSAEVDNASVASEREASQAPETDDASIADEPKQWQQDPEDKASKFQDGAGAVPMLREQNAGLLGQLGAANLRIEQLGAANQAGAAEVAALRAHIASLHLRPPLSPSSWDGSSVSSRRKKSGSKSRSKDDLVVVRSPGDRTSFQVMRKSELYQSRSPSRSRADSD